MSDQKVYSITIILAATFLIIAAMASIGYSAQTKNELMAKDVQTALEKGINPIVIRCAYAEEGDRICLVYAATRTPETRIDLIKSK